MNCVNQLNYMEWAEFQFNFIVTIHMATAALH